MQIKIGMENGIEGRSLAWVLDYPSCFVYGSDGSEAIIRVPEALLRYKNWVDSHPPDSWMQDLVDFDIHLEETFEVFNINEDSDLVEKGYEVNAWFRHDWKPLTVEDIRRGTYILQWSREDLLELVAGLTLDQMTREFEGERLSIAGVLRHIAGAEYWYLDRLGFAGIPRRDLPEDVFERLLTVRQRLNTVLPELESMQKVVGVNAEFWSARKVLRRAAWHEIDHIQHIFNLISRF